MSKLAITTYSFSKYYYVDVRTDEPQWTKPMLMGTKELDYDYEKITKDEPPTDWEPESGDEDGDGAIPPLDIEPAADY